MADIKIEFHAEGIRELRRDPALIEFTNSVAAGVAANLGDGYESQESMSSRTRARAHVQPNTIETKIDVLRDPTILVSALSGGGRG